MTKVLVVVADGCGIGDAPDAQRFGTEGSNTLGHVLERESPDLPTLERAGLRHLLGEEGPDRPEAVVCTLTPESAGNDTPTGHWELMGCPTEHAPRTYPTGFPSEVLEEFSRRAGVSTVLGNTVENGVAIINRLGEEHLRTGLPIVYTSADSVFQIAAHTAKVSLEELYQWCEAAREVLRGEHSVGRVIARPFEGSVGGFSRRPERRDWSLTPPDDTALDVLARNNVRTVGVGKIGDIFAHRGLSEESHPGGNEACMEETDRVLSTLESGLVFVNLVDFDSRYGHVRDSEGFAAALEAMDAWLGRVREGHPEVTLVLSADHGNDPTAPGSDHTREQVPLLIWGSDGGGYLGEMPMRSLGPYLCSLFGVTWKHPEDDTISLRKGAP